MELPVRLPILPSQCYPPSPNHGLEGCHGVSASRKPLHESTGNAQHPHMAWFAQHLDTLSSIPPPLPTPPILRTQFVGSEYGTLPYTKPQRRPELHLHGRGSLEGANPLIPLLPRAFQQYRKKQLDKPDQKWPDVLEWHFIDAILLIPQMGRKKYTMEQRQYGRNMLIGKYLWIAYCQTLPPGMEPEEADMGKRRKKVSSHIQVLKKFFENHRCFHFFFTQRQEDKDSKSDIETLSLKHNPILIALSEGRLPDERPDYEYFAQILALNNLVAVRPKRCWIFVSHQDVVVGEDGSGYLPATGDKLNESEYPHLVRNLERETWAKEEQQIFGGALLHEFTKEMRQTESSTVTELSRKWETAFPELHQRLKTITAATTDARLTILHMQVTLELKEKRRFPTQSELNSWVEINIEQPRLLNHRWKVHTRLARPAELSYSHDDSAPETLYETSAEIPIQYQHRPGCDGPRDSRGQCECILQGYRRDWVAVPFPADIWALTLTNCAEYPAHPFGDSTRPDKEEPQDDEPRSRRRNNKQPTQMDLVPKIAMMQEIWSCPPSSPQERNPRWTRRALLLWTFKTVHSIEDGKLVTAQGGRTDWRFLTILDPTSEYHQQRAIARGRRTSDDAHGEGPVSLASSCTRQVNRDAVMSQSRAYQQQLSATMSEAFSPTWDDAGGLGTLSSSAAPAAYSSHLMAQQTPSPATTVQAGYGLLNSFSSHSGIATPPPSASVTSPFAHGFDTASNSAELLPRFMTNHVTVTTAGVEACSQQSLGVSLAAVTDPFLAHVRTTYGGESHDSIHGWNNQGVGNSMEPATAWQSGYHHGNGAHGHGSTGRWTGPHPQMALKHGGGGGGSSSSRSDKQATIDLVGEQQYNPASGGAGGDERDLWTPSTAANTPVETVAGRAGSQDQAVTLEAGQEWMHVQADPEASQEWVQVQTDSAEGESDLSQDWEEIAALQGTASRSLSPPFPTPPGGGVDGVPGKHDNTRIVAAAVGERPQGPAKSLKRRRSDSFEVVREEESFRRCRSRS